MRPIFHLSFPVRDLQESIDFYVTRLGAQIGRRNDMGADALVFGAQITLQNDPASVIDPMPRTRHFGATLPWRSDRAGQDDDRRPDREPDRDQGLPESN